MAYRLKILPIVHKDIQEGISWYNSRQTGLGKRFHEAVKAEYNILKRHPHFQIRYDGVRCLPMKTFPYMIHYIVEEEKKRVVVLGVINTYKDPDKWMDRAK